jgi:hypothetical protein
MPDYTPAAPTFFNNIAPDQPFVAKRASADGKRTFSSRRCFNQLVGADER